MHSKEREEREQEDNGMSLIREDNFEASHFVFLLRGKELAKTKVGNTRPFVFMRPIFGPLVIEENE